MKIEVADNTVDERVLTQNPGTLDIVIGRSARLTLTLVSELVASDPQKLGTQVKIDESGSFEFVGFTCGNGSLEHRAEVHLNGREARASLNGLSLLSGEATVKNETVVHHSGLATTSRQLFKDILSDKSRSEYSGLVHVHRGADKSDSGQLARNLLLSDDARADSKPMLKIDADDVKCTHGSSIGQISPQEVFYLRSRGIEENVARRLLIYGFAEEVIEALGDDVRAPLEKLIERELAHVLDQTS